MILRNGKISVKILRKFFWKISHLTSLDSGSTHLWNVRLFQRDYTVLYPTRLVISYLPPWEPEISQRRLTREQNPTRKRRVYLSNFPKSLRQEGEYNNFWGPPSLVSNAYRGSFPLGIKRGRGVTLTTHPHLIPKSWMSRSYTSSPPAPP
jgi:hypothetical protein